MYDRCLVISILLEELLYTISAEEKRVFLDCLGVLPIVVIHVLLIEVVLLVRGYVGRDQALIL